MHENRLIFEKSPYLLQHAHNPVDWYPWGQDAFEKARGEQKPVFLSVGYSTCHWCHVMERESFEDEEVAELLNRGFVSIKVDREERPDVDAVYMSVCQAMTGAGGWPLSILMTPDQKPFWAGTYLPKRSRYGAPGLMELLGEVLQLWKFDREKLLGAGDQVTAHITAERKTASAVPEKGVLRAAAEQFLHSFDPANGGFGEAPKFPMPHNLLFLMKYAAQEQDAQAMQMAETTLTQMARGGLFDQIGGGFSRYSTDAKWLAPHFEKMLYDNALLAYAYLEAYRTTGQNFYRTVAERTLGYTLRELTDPSGGFYCGQDADSDGEEGKYYLFTPEEVQKILGETDGISFCAWFDVMEKGNFEGRSIPNLLDNPQYEHPPVEITDSCARLLAYRPTRTALHKDDKVLTAWNALMIGAMAKAYRVQGDAPYLEAAKQAREFLKSRLTTTEGKLWLRWRDGQAAHTGQLDDYAFLAWGLLELYAASYDVACLADAAQLTGWMESLFWDAQAGGFYLTASDAEELIARPKELYDGAIPSGNAVAAVVLVRLAALTGEPRWQGLAERQLSYITGTAREYPMGYSFSLLALCEALYPSRELVCAISDQPPDELRTLSEAHNLRTLVKTLENAKKLEQIAPFTAGYPLPETGEAYYLCQNGACSAPVYSLQELKQLLSD